MEREPGDLVVAEVVVHPERAPVGCLDHAPLERRVHLAARQGHDAGARAPPDLRAEAFRHAHLHALEVGQAPERFLGGDGLDAPPDRAHVVDVEPPVDLARQLEAAPVLEPQLHLVGVLEAAVQVADERQRRLLAREVGAAAVVRVEHAVRQRVQRLSVTHDRADRQRLDLDPAARGFLDPPGPVLEHLLVDRAGLPEGLHLPLVGLLGGGEAWSRSARGDGHRAGRGLPELASVDHRVSPVCGRRFTRGRLVRHYGHGAPVKTAGTGNLEGESRAWLEELASGFQSLSAPAILAGLKAWESHPDTG
jgi:hypothetical protein